MIKECANTSAYKDEHVHTHVYIHTYVCEWNQYSQCIEVIFVFIILQRFISQAGALNRVKLIRSRQGTQHTYANTGVCMCICVSVHTCLGICTVALVFGKLPAREKQYISSQKGLAHIHSRSFGYSYTYICMYHLCVYTWEHTLTQIFAKCENFITTYTFYLN